MQGWSADSADQQISGRAGGGLEPGVAPDWSKLDREVVCPLCEYNLRGLSDARCPECGSEFTWDDLLDPRRLEHPYLFEHHPERNFWSAWRTLIGGLRPLAFWTTLHPLQPTSLARMLIYAAVMWAVSIVSYGCAVPVHLLAKDTVTQNWWTTGAMAGWTRPSLVDQTMNQFASVGFLAACCLPVIWAVFTFLSFMIFGISMHRARVRNVHVARAVIYAFDGIVWAALGLLALFGTWQVILWYSDGKMEDAFRSIGVCWIFMLIAGYYWLTARPELKAKRWAAAILCPVVVLTIALTIIVGEVVLLGGPFMHLTNAPLPVSGIWLLFTWVFIVGRLVTAFRQYLQFRHSVAVVIASQIITALAIPVTAIIVGAVAKLL